VEKISWHIFYKILGSPLMAIKPVDAGGCGYPRISDSVDAGAGLKFNPWVHPHPNPQYAGAGADLEFHPWMNPHPHHT